MSKTQKKKGCGLSSDRQQMVESLKREHQYMRPQDMPDPYKHPDYYARMKAEGRLVVLRENPGTAGTAASSPYSDRETIDGIRLYLQPIECMKGDKWSEETFKVMLQRIIANRTVLGYLREAQRQKGVRPMFNKWRIFYLIGYLRLVHVYDIYGAQRTQRDVEMVLEGKLVGYHSHMGRGIPTEVAKAIDGIISNFK